jgi:hypothetical protein
VGAVAGAGAGAGQSAIVRLDEPELELPSRVSAAVHDDDAVTAPLLLGIGTVSVDVLPGNDVVPWITRGAPLAGVNTISHAGLFSPPFPFPDALKIAQSKVTDPQVAVAVTVCAAALAAKIASIAIVSEMTCRERRTIARRIPTLVGVGVALSVIILALLLVGTVRNLLRHGGKVRTRRLATRSCVARAASFGERRVVSRREHQMLADIAPRAPPAEFVTAGPSSPTRV